MQNPLEQRCNKASVWAQKNDKNSPRTATWCSARFSIPPRSNHCGGPLTAWSIGHTRRLYDSAKIAHLYEGAAFQERWARVDREYQGHPNRQPLARSWGGAELLDRAVYDLYTHPRITAIATALLGAELMRPLLLPGFHCSASFSTGAATQNLWPGPRTSPLART